MMVKEEPQDNCVDVTKTTAGAYKRIKDLIRETMAVCLKPPPKLNLVEWADKYRFLPDNSAESGRWKTSRVEVGRQPMISVTDPDVQEVTIMCCIQLMKHLAIDTPLLTTSGWKTMKDVVKGDRVYGSNGKECNVLAVSEISTSEPCYEITFSDGAKVTCSESHNWTIDDSNRNTITVSTGVMFNELSETALFVRHAKPLSRKIIDYNQNHTSNDYKAREIINIDKVDDVPVRCIAVDSVDHLYLCGRELIPTHNTELMLNTALFYMHQEPSPLMYVAPKADLAEAWSKERFVKSVSATPVLKDIFKSNRRGEGNTITQKQFTGGQISIVSARNPADLAMRAVRVVMFDECDKYPMNTGSSGGGEGGEGDPITVAWGRATTYGKRAKKLVACSPTIKHKSRVEQEYENSNMSIFQQKCPHCEDLQSLTWVNVHIPRDENEVFDHQNACIVCPDCSVPWSESDRHYSIRNGEWLATKPEVTWHHGYKVSALASPFTPVPVLAKEFANAQGNPEKLKAFKNTRLAETWAEAGEKPEWRTLYDRREAYPTQIVPEGMVILTCGIDVQKDHIYYEVVAWGKKNESYSIDKGVINGKFEDDEFVEALTLFCDSTYKDHNGVDVIMSKICIDSGYNTNEVYKFCRNYGSSRVVPVKGDGGLQVSVGTPRPVDVLIDGTRHSRGLQLWAVGVSVIKEQVYRWFNAKAPTDEAQEKGATFPTGYCHFPMYDEEYFKQITAEQLVTRTNKRGYSISEWETTRKDNHLLDCRVYARAGAVMLQIDRMTSEDFDAILAQRVPATLEQKIQKAVPKKRKKSGWIKK